SYGTITYPSSANDLNAFDLTVLAAYHNGALASNWCIYPVDRTWRYPDPGFEYDVRAWPSIDIYKMRPWVTPTVANYLMIRDSDGKFYKGKFVAALNERIENVGGTKIFDTGSDHWTINMSDASNAMSITIGLGNGTVTARPKQDVLFFRPFMVF
ncbi:MAG: hypothetical protein J5495_03440, partial [Bacteroidales bacterium]|nr:hypothetical protein [Bacteroidales bacterium]